MRLTEIGFHKPIIIIIVAEIFLTLWFTFNVLIIDELEVRELNTATVSVLVAVFLLFVLHLFIYKNRLKRSIIIF